jgi:hypothetical protein
MMRGEDRFVSVRTILYNRSNLYKSKRVQQRSERERWENVGCLLPSR